MASQIHCWREILPRKTSSFPLQTFCYLFLLVVVRLPAGTTSTCEHQHWYLLVPGYKNILQWTFSFRFTLSLLKMHDSSSDADHGRCDCYCSTPPWQRKGHSCSHAFPLPPGRAEVSPGTSIPALTFEKPVKSRGRL